MFILPRAEEEKYLVVRYPPYTKMRGFLDTREPEKKQPTLWILRERKITRADLFVTEFFE